MVNLKIPEVIRLALSGVKIYINNVKNELQGNINNINESKADKSELFSGSYNDLTNKPCYEEIIEVDEITFDGTVKDPDELIGGFFVKVAYGPTQIDEFIGKTMKIKNMVTEEETTKIIDESLIETYEYGESSILYSIDAGKIIVATDTINFSPGMVFNKGIYFSLLSEYVSYLEISATLQNIKRLDEKFLPNLVGESTTGKTFTVYDNIEDMNNNINGISVVAEANAEIFNSKDNVAVGECSHAEGDETIANGYVAHAEGFKCVANKNYSHAEGMNTFANGYVSHTEGDDTIANGRCAHAEGQNTIASGDNQHVQGKFNIEDTENKYAHIVGGGRQYGQMVDGEFINIKEPKNIHTLDWNGNAWFQGNVSIDGTPTNDNDLVTKKYVDDNKFSGNYNDLENKPVIPSIDGLASETYVNNKVAELVDSAPEALNTLNELAQALGDNPNFATTVSEEIGKKVNDVDLAAVAKSGSYNDLTNKPEIPSVEGLATETYVNNKLSNLQLLRITQEDYNALATKDPNTLYIIVE